MTITMAQPKYQELENKRLKLVIKKLHLEIAMLKAEKRGRSPRRPDSAYGSERSCSPSPSPFSPSASRSSSPVPTQQWEDSTESGFTWIDDQVKQPDWTDPEPEGESQESGFTWTNDEQVKQPDWIEPVVDGSPENSSDPWAWTESPESEPIVETEMTALERLEESSRLRERGFYSTQAGQVDIPLVAQQGLMEVARSHARDALWESLGKYWPEGQVRHYFHGPIAVRYGREELNLTVGSEASARIARGMGVESSKIEYALDDVIRLRNALSHQEFISSSMIDELMSHAQRLACALGDEERALKIRTARDELQQQAKAAHEVMVTCEPLLRAPAPHHQEVFYRMRHELEESWREPQLNKKHGCDVVRAGKEWVVRYSRPGEERPNWQEKR